jgi:hypothetical protein
MSRRWFAGPVVIAVVAALGFGCAPTPRSRPLRTSPVGESLEEVRKQLEGTWNLVTLELHPAGGKPVQVGARGMLVYDAYGNLEITGTVTDAAYAKTADSRLLASKGRAVIDVTNRQLRLLDVQGNVTKVAAEVSADLIRRYAFEGGLLRLTSVDAGGRVTAVVTWKKQ